MNFFEGNKSKPPSEPKAAPREYDINRGSATSKSTLNEDFVEITEETSYPRRNENRRHQATNEFETDFINRNQTSIENRFGELEQITSQAAAATITASPPTANENIPNEIKQEDLNKIYEDFEKIPYCSEKLILKLIYYISKAIKNNQTELSSKFNYQEEIEKLIERLQIEDFYLEKNKQLVDEISSYLFNGDLNESLKKLNNLLANIRDINIQELIRLTNTNNEAIKILRNKNIYFLIGLTGSGKSTTLHFLGGSKMENKPRNGQPHIAPTTINNPYLKKVTTSPTINSETRNIFPVVIQLNPDDGYAEDSAIICDTPGFEDSNGPEIDIANSISIQNAVQICKGIKPVIVISSKIGDRFERLTVLTQVLAGMLQNLEQDIEKFAYLFTKYKKEERTAIRAQLINIKKEINNNDYSRFDSGFKIVIEDMVNKFRKIDELVIIDPLSDDPNQALQSIIDNKFIQSPARHFKISFSVKTKVKIEKQMQKHLQMLKNSLSRNEYELAMYKLNELIELRKLIDQKDIDESFQNIVVNIIKDVNKELNKVISHFNKKVDRNELFNEDDVNDYMTCLRNAKNSEEIIRKLDETSSNKHNELKENLEKQIDLILNNLKMSNVDSQSDSIVIYLDNLKFLVKHLAESYEENKLKVFEHIQTKYENGRNILMDKIKQQIDSNKSLLLSNEFDKIAKEMSKLQKFGTKFGDHLKNLNESYEEMLELFKRNLIENRLNSFETIFRKEILDENDFNKLDENDVYYVMALRCLVLHQHIDRDLIEDLYKKFLYKVKDYFNMIQSKASGELQNRRAPVIEQLEVYFQQMSLLRRNVEFETETQKAYTESLEELAHFVDRLKEEVNSVLNRIHAKSEQPNYNKLVKNLRLLNNLKWIEMYKKNAYNYAFSDIEENLIGHIDQIREPLDYMTVSLENSDQIKQIYDLVKSIVANEPLCEIFDKIKYPIEKVRDDFTKQLSNQFESIKMLYENVNTQSQLVDTEINYDRAEKSLEFINACRDIPDIYKGSMFSLAQENLNSYLRKRDSYLKTELEQSFSFILISDLNSSSEASMRASMMASCLNEIGNVKLHYPNCFKLFPQDILNDWRRRLSETAKDLESKIEDLITIQNLQELPNKLSIVKSLAKLDEFLDSNNEIFSNLFSKNNRQAKQASREIFDTSREDIDNLDFRNLHENLLLLNEAYETDLHYLTIIGKKLNNKLKEIIKVTRTKAKILDDFSQEELREIKENINYIRDANEYLSKYLDDTNKIEEFEKDIREAVESSVDKYVKIIEEHIRRVDIANAQSKIDNLFRAREFFIQLNLPNSLQKINDLKTNQESLIIKSIEEFAKYEIHDYFYHSPKEIYDRLSSVNENGNEALRRFKEIIREKFNKELEKAVKDDPPSVDNNDYLRKCEKYLVNLPQEIRDNIQNEIDMNRSIINRKVLTSELDLMKTLDDYDFDRIHENYMKYVQSGQKYHIEKIKQFIIEQKNKLTNQMTKSYDEKNYKEFFIYYEKLVHLNQTFVGQIPQIKHDFTNYTLKVKTLFDEAYSNIFQVLANKNVKYSPTFISEINLELCYEVLIKIIELENKPYAKNLFNNNPESLYRDNLNLLNTKLIEQISFVQTNFDDALKKNDFMSIRFFLSTMNIFDGLIKKNKNYIYTSTAVSSASASSPHHQHSSSGFVVGLNTISYDEMKRETVEKIESLFNEIENIKLKQGKNLFQSDFDNFFEDKNYKINLIRDAVKHLNDILPEYKLKQREKELSDLFQKKITSLYDDAQANLDRALSVSNSSGGTGSSDYLDNFINNFYNLAAYNKKIQNDGTTDNSKKVLSEIEKPFLVKILKKAEMLSVGLNGKSQDDAAKVFIQIKELSSQFYVFKNQIDEKLEIIMNNYITHNGGFDIIGGLALTLKRSTIGSIIVSEHKCFETYQRALFNRRTITQDIKYVLTDLKGDSLDLNSLRNFFDEFKAHFDSLIENFLTPKIDFNLFISNINVLVSKLKTDPSNIIWDKYLIESLPSLIALIFSLWTLINAKNYFQISGEKTNYLFLPHPAQIIAIFRMLGVGYNSTRGLINNLVQIGTGEGKSVTLAVTAVVLALLGFDVYCVCYSEYLSKRDYNTFKELFQLLDLKKFIHYGTFNSVCEEVINEHGDVRKIVKDFIVNGNINKAKRAQSERPKILLIDEVDVFFSRDFYGNHYQPSLNLADPTITNLINMVWKEKATINLIDIKSSKEFKECCDKFTQWKDLIVEACKDIINDLKTFESHDYIVKNNKIGYKDQDNYVYDINYGYKTLFAYYLENEKGKISKESLNENISLLIRLGSFSYAEIPKKFKAILGVTGTLETLCDTEKRIIEKEYLIKYKTFIPSVYGKNMLRFEPKENVSVEKDENFYKLLKLEIDKRMVGVTEKTKRAVFLFFESKHELMRFYESDAFVPYKNQAVILTEEASLQEKMNIINNSTSSGKITLFTRIFGRGTDFVVHDGIVSSNGGVHVLQTFLSEEYSEEVQIRGRTARQGEQGTYSMILNKTSLEKFLIKTEEIEAVSVSGMYEFLDKKRKAFFEIKYKENIKYVENIRLSHKTSTKFLENILNENLNEVKKFLIKENKGVEQQAHSRTLILMDATGSMYYLLDKTKQTLQNMFERVYQVLSEQNINLDSFMIKIAVYRNYNSTPDMLLQTSSWENKPQNLINFLYGVDVDGGWINEAIEVGLWQANQEKDLTQVILIGDAPANTLNEVKEKRKHGNWKKTKFEKQTFYQDELNILKTKNIAVHSFYVDKRAKDNFKEIATTTGGKFEFLDIESNQGSEILTNLINIEVLRNIGGEAQGSALVQAYRNKYNAFNVGGDDQ